MLSMILLIAGGGFLLNPETGQISAYDNCIDLADHPEESYHYGIDHYVGLKDYKINTADHLLFSGLSFCEGVKYSFNSISKIWQPPKIS